MQSENVYIGDDKFKKFLSHYSCPTELYEVKLKFVGAICSPNPNLRPTDVIASLFEENKQPRLETKAQIALVKSGNHKLIMYFLETIQNICDFKALTLLQERANRKEIELFYSRYSLA